MLIIRNPSTTGWHIARTSGEAVALLETHGCPREISFEHDLGGDDTAMVVGSFRSTAAMVESLEKGEFDVIGVARPICPSGLKED